MLLKIGTAGWSIPRAIAAEFPTEGSALERYSAKFQVAEINSSFHRPHRVSTWRRWRESVREDFRFSVKLPKIVTHQRQLTDCERELDDFAEQVGELGQKLAILLVQLPPKLAFNEGVARSFFAELAARTSARLACEPRHVSWFSAEANELLRQMSVARVAADPALCAEASKPGGSLVIQYWRLHGSPVIYRSSYRDRILSLANEIKADCDDGAELWCIFDNTASSAAAGDALALTAASSSEACNSARASGANDREQPSEVVQPSRKGSAASHDSS